MTTEDALRALAHCLSVMPANFPKPRLVFHDSAESLVEFMGNKHFEFHSSNGFQPAQLAAMADAEHNRIHIPLTLIYEEQPETIYGTLVHEIGHLRQAQRYGNNSKEFLNEDRANRFERSWTKRVLAFTKLVESKPTKKRQ